MAVPIDLGTGVGVGGGGGGDPRDDADDRAGDDGSFRGATAQQVGAMVLKLHVGDPELDRDDWYQRVRAALRGLTKDGQVDMLNLNRFRLAEDEGDGDVEAERAVQRRGSHASGGAGKYKASPGYPATRVPRVPRVPRPRGQIPFVRSPEKDHSSPSPSARVSPSRSIPTHSRSNRSPRARTSTYASSSGPSLEPR